MLMAGRNWGSGSSFDPQERELAQLAAIIRPAESAREYLDPQRSPSNLRRYEVDSSSAAYSSLLLLLPRAIQDNAEHLASDMLRDGRTVCRFLAIGTIVLTAVLAWLAFGTPRDASVAILLLGGAVLQIRAGHYFLPESPFGLAATMGLIGTILMTQGRGYSGAALAGSSLAGACAVDPHGLLLLIPMLAAWWGQARGTGGVKIADRALFALGVLFIVAAVTFRVLSPYAFEHVDGIGLNPTFAQSASALLGMGADEAAWIPLETQLLMPKLGATLGWGIGGPLLIAMFVGVPVGVGARWKKARIQLPLLLWVGCALVVAALQPQAQLLLVTAALPALAVLAGNGVAALIRNSPQSPMKGGAVVVLLLWVAVSGRPYATLFDSESTLIRASRWIEQQIPKGAIVSSEQGDLRLPVAVEGKVAGPYRHLELRIVADNPELARRELAAGLAASEYHISSSQYPELWASGIAPGEATAWRRTAVARAFFDGMREDGFGADVVARFAPPDRKVARIVRGSWAPLREAPAWMLRGLAPDIVIRRRVRKLSAAEVHERLKR